MLLRLHGVLREVVGLDRVLRLDIGLMVEDRSGFSLLTILCLLSLFIESLLCTLATWPTDMLLMHRVRLSVVAVRAAIGCLSGLILGGVGGQLLFL